MSNLPILQQLTKHWIFVAFLAGTMIQAVAQTQVPNAVADSVSGFEKAIELEEQLSTERREWSRQTRILEAEIDMIEAQLVDTERRIESIKSERSEAREKRERLLASLEKEETASQQLDKLINKLLPPTTRLQSLLPPWIEGDAETPEFTEETPAIVLLRKIREVQAANSRIDALPIRITDPETNTEYRVDLIAFGLGGAYFVSEDGSFGGRYLFDGTKWSPEITPPFTATISKAIAQAEGRGEPELVELPVSISRQK